MKNKFFCFLLPFIYMLIDVFVWLYITQYYQWHVLNVVFSFFLFWLFIEGVKDHIDILNCHHMDISTSTEMTVLSANEVSLPSREYTQHPYKKQLAAHFILASILFLLPACYSFANNLSPCLQHNSTLNWDSTNASTAINIFQGRLNWSDSVLVHFSIYTMIAWFWISKNRYIAS